MSTFVLSFRSRAMGAAVLGLVLSGCGGGDKVDSIPGPGRPSAASSGEKAAVQDPLKDVDPPRASGTSPTTGLNSAGLPSGASGGAVAAGSGSGTSGTVTSGDAPKRDDKR